MKDYNAGYKKGGYMKFMFLINFLKVCIVKKIEDRTMY